VLLLAGQWLRAIILGLVLIFPAWISAVDHHGAERVPMHEHDVPFGQPVPDHNHQFQIAHDHAGPVLEPASLASAIATQPYITVGALMDHLVVPLVVLIMCCAVTGRSRESVLAVLDDQLALAPPTHPPAIFGAT